MNEVRTSSLLLRSHLHTVEPVDSQHHRFLYLKHWRDFVRKETKRGQPLRFVPETGLSTLSIFFDRSSFEVEKKALSIRSQRTRKTMNSKDSIFRRKPIAVFFSVVFSLVKERRVKFFKMCAYRSRIARTE